MRFVVRVLVVLLFFGLILFNVLFQRLDESYFCLRCGRALYRSCFSFNPGKFHLPLSRFELFSRTTEANSPAIADVPKDLLDILYGKTLSHEHLWGLTFRNRGKNAFISSHPDGHYIGFWRDYWNHLRTIENQLRWISSMHPHEAGIIAESMLLCASKTAENSGWDGLKEALENLEFSPGGWEKFWSQFGPIMKSEKKPDLFQE